MVSEFYWIQISISYLYILFFGSLRGSSTVNYSISSFMRTVKNIYFGLLLMCDRIWLMNINNFLTSNVLYLCVELIDIMDFVVAN